MRQRLYRMLVIDTKFLSKSYEYIVYVSIRIRVEIMFTGANDQLVTQTGNDARYAVHQ